MNDSPVVTTSLCFARSMTLGSLTGSKDGQTRGTCRPRSGPAGELLRCSGDADPSAIREAGHLTVASCPTRAIATARAQTGKPPSRTIIRR